MNCEPCHYFRNKKMLIPAQEATAFSLEPDPYASTHCWCNQTMTEVGADNERVSMQRCSVAQRKCFERR